MNTTLTVIILAVAAASILAATMAVRGCHRLNLELEKARAKLNETNMEVGQLRSELSLSTKQDGVSQETVLAIAGEMNRMENNLIRMQDVPGRKQVIKALQRIGSALLAEGYSIVPLQGKPFTEGMMVSASFIEDEDLPPGTSIITSVQAPQVNRYGKMIQAGRVTVTRNI